MAIQQPITLFQTYYEKYKGSRDEWTLSEAIINDPKSGGLEAFLEKHYDTFIVRPIPLFAYAPLLSRLRNLFSCPGYSMFAFFRLRKISLRSPVQVWGGFASRCHSGQLRRATTSLSFPKSHGNTF